MPLNLCELECLRALVVEDNEDDYTLLIDHLESYGVNLVSARVDNEIDLKIKLNESWDIILSDFSMPKLSGSRALEIVRSQDPNTPFIYVSGTIGETVAVKAIKSGAQNYVMKSDFGRLLPTIERELEDAKTRLEQTKNDELLRKLSLAVNQTVDSVFITNHEGIIEYVNPAFERLSGYSEDEIIGKNPSFLKSNKHDQSFYNSLWKCVTQGKAFEATFINKRKDGSEYFEEKVITPLFNSSGVLTHFVSTGRDITARIETQKAKERIQAIINATPDIVVILDEKGRVLHLNKQALLTFGISSHVNLDNLPNMNAIFDDETIEKLTNEVFPQAKEVGQWSGEFEIKHVIESTPILPTLMIVLYHQDEHANSYYYSIVARDISERKHFEAELQHQATHDQLTHLPNRNYFIIRLKAALQRATTKSLTLAVLIVDVDQFKRINDSLGHLAGDQLLKKISIRLKRFLKRNESIARLGSDEFAILIEDTDAPDNIITRLNTLVSIFNIPLQIEDQEIFINFSAGVSVFPKDAESETDLLKHANIARLRSKSLGLNSYNFYSPDMNLKGQELLQLETELRYAIANKELCLFYQPQLELKSRKIVALEALLRWNSPKKGLVSPAEFVPLLEKTGLILAVGEWIIEQACIQIQNLADSMRDHIRISVNVSAVQLQEASFTSKVSNIVRKYNIPKDKLELEVTENMLMHDSERAASIILELNELGVRTAIDDFGTGYSSLAYLKRFPVSILKIDQSFIGDVLSSKSDATIVEASVALAHKLGLEVVAEGVETDQQLNFLKQINCDLAQGYLISKPTPIDKLFELL